MTQVTLDELGPPLAGCPIASAVDVIFSRWTTPILWQLNNNGRQRFSDLRDLVEGITAKVLTQRLRQLERDGLVSRTMHAEIPPRVEYEITDLGRSQQSRAAYDKAIELAGNTAETAYLTRRRDQLG